MKVLMTGIVRFISFQETTPAQCQQIIDVNLTGVYNGVKAASDQMVCQGGGHFIS